MSTSKPTNTGLMIEVPATPQSSRITRASLEGSITAVKNTPSSSGMSTATGGIASVMTRSRAKCIKEVHMLAEQMRAQQARDVPQIKFQPIPGRCAGVVYKIDDMGRIKHEDRRHPSLFNQLCQGVVCFAIPLPNNRAWTGTISFPKREAEVTQLAYGGRVALAQRLNLLGPRLAVETTRRVHACRSGR